MGRTQQLACGAILVLGILAFGLWSLFFFSPAVPINVDQPVSQPNAEYVAGGAECRPDRLRLTPANVREAKETECAERLEQHRKGQADLVQQTRAANAGQVMVFLTKDQIRIALLQAVLSLIGVIATALAAWGAVVAANAARASVEDARTDAAQQAERFQWQLKAAQDAASAAERGALATRRMAMVMRDQVELAEAGQRPWVSLSVTPFKSFRFEKGEAVTEPNIRMTNHGKRVARNVVTWAEMYVHTDDSEPIVLRDAALDRLRAKINKSLDNPKFHRRLIFPGQFACFAPSVRCESVSEDIYRLIVLVSYDFEGAKDRHFTWAMFDIFTADNRIISKVRGNLALDEWMATATGVGDAT